MNFSLQSALKFPLALYPLKNCMKMLLFVRPIVHQTQLRHYKQNNQNLFVFCHRSDTFLW